MYSHMNNNIYGGLVDSIVNAYLMENCGLEPHNPHSTAQIGLVATSFMDFFASIAYPAVADVGLRVSKLGTSSVTYEVGIFEKGVESVKAVGGFTHVWVEREGMSGGNFKAKDGQKKGMRPEVRKGLEKLLVGPGNDKAKL